MIYRNIEFHNVDHLSQLEGMSGLLLNRFPEEFSKKLGVVKNTNGRFRANRVHGCELRFVTEAGYFDLALTAVEGDIDILIYYGDMFHEKHTLRAGVTTVLHITNPEIYKLVEEEKLMKGRFAPKVWRVMFGLNGYAYFHYVNTYGHEIRPPKEEEKPDILWAAYGSSITCGSVASLYSNSYINQAAIRLGADVMNKGLSGACLCEEFVADYLASLNVDILSLELGVNMVMFFHEKEFKERMDYFLTKIKESPAKEIFVIDMFPNKGLIAKDKNSDYYVNYRAFKQVLREWMQEYADSRMKLIHGEDIVTELSYLSTDLLHPGDNGHIQMGEHLAKLMKGENE